MLKNFAASASRSLTVETTLGRMPKLRRSGIGNTSALQNLPAFLAVLRAAAAAAEHARLQPRRRDCDLQPIDEPAASFAALRFCSIWSIAETTASKVRSVEAWRAL